MQQVGHAAPTDTIGIQSFWKIYTFVICEQMGCWQKQYTNKNHTDKANPTQSPHWMLSQVI